MVDEGKSGQGFLQVLDEVRRIFGAGIHELLPLFLAQVARQQEALHQLSRDVLSIGCAAAVAADEQFAAFSVAVDNRFDSGFQRLFHGSEHRIALD